MIKRIKDVNKILSKSGNTLLHKAVQYNKKDIVKVLLENGADFYASNNEDVRAIDYLTNREIVQMILDAGFDINNRNKKNQTMLHIATKSKLLDFILQKNPENMNATDLYGNIPLHQAVLQNNYDNIKILIDNKSDVFARNSSNLSPLGLAKHVKQAYNYDNQVIIDLLKEAELNNRLFLPIEQGEECPICLEEFDDTKPICMVRPCNHKFHISCIVKWVDEGKDKCPLCRRKITLIKQFFIRNTPFGIKIKKKIFLKGINGNVFSRSS